MACFNRNTQEYKNLLEIFNTNMQVDGIITTWQNINKTDSFPTVKQAEQFLKDKKIAFNLQQRNFSEAILGNLSRRNLISKYKNSYYINNSNRYSRVYDVVTLNENLKAVKRYLEINNIPQDAVKFEKTNKSIKIVIDENLFTPKDILNKTRGWDSNRTRHIAVHLMRMFPDVKIKLVSPSEAEEYYESLPSWQKSNVPFNKVNSYFDPFNNQVVLIEGRVTDETAIEEMLHPFTDALYVDNKALFDSLLIEAKKTFPVLNQQIEDSYSNRRGFTQKHRDLELVTQSLTRHFKKEYEENPTKTFLEKVKEFVEWFAGIINNLHKYITGKTLSQYTSTQQKQEIKPGMEAIDGVFKDSPELASIGTKAQYMQYLSTIFPDSKVRDIVYHGTTSEFDIFDKKVLGKTTKAMSAKEAFFFATNKDAVIRYANPENITEVLNYEEVLRKNFNLKATEKVPLSHNDIDEIFKGDEPFMLNMYHEMFDNILDDFDFNSINVKEGYSTVKGWKTGNEYKIYSKIIPVVLNIKRPLVKNYNNEFYRDETYYNLQVQAKNENKDSTILKNTYDSRDRWNTIKADVITVFEPEQIHILGNKQDIEGFKEFVNKSKESETKSTIYKLDIKDIKSTTKLSDIAKLLNTSDIQFDVNARADAKIRFSLTPELQSVVDYALKQANGVQSKIINRLFHQATSTKEEVSSLSAGDSGPIVVLNEENHVYYNVLDINETFKSTTERIKGKLSEKDLFNKKLNIDLGNDFDKLLQGLTSDKSVDDVFSQMKVLSKEQAEKAYIMLQENLNEITRGGGIAIPQVVVYDETSKTAGSIDILVVMPDGKLRIVDLKTSKNSVKNMSSVEYDKEYELGPTSDLKQYGIDTLSTRAQQGIQVNTYRRMLSNMGYEVDMDNMGASTFHIQVGVKGKNTEQEFTGEFKSDEWIMHPISQNEPYVDLLIPKNKNTFYAEEIEENIKEELDKSINWDKELAEEEKIPENKESTNSYTEFEVITQALEDYRVALVTKLKALEQIKSAIYMDRTKEQTQENILNALSAIAIAMEEGPKARAALYTELTRDALKQIRNFASYVKNPQNFDKPEYITYVLNFSRFIKTFEGLYSIKSSKELNPTQRTLITELQIKLNELGANNLKQEGLINEAITNYVKEQIKTWSKRDDLTEDVLNDLMKYARDISLWELNTGDISTSSDTILAIMDKIYKAKKQEVFDKIETRNITIMNLASRLQKLSPNKNTQELYDFMLEFDEDGEFSGRYVQRLGKQYFKKQQELRDKLYDDNGNPYEYRDIDDVSTAEKEDLEFNINLAKAKAEYAAFWTAEKIGLDNKLKDGDLHKYTDEFKTERAKYQYYISINGKPIWKRKPGVSDKAYQIFLAKYYNEIEYTYAHRDQNGNYTGGITRQKIFYAVKPKYRIANDYNLSTGERLINEKYEKIMNPTDALGVAQKEFYLAFNKYYENELLSKIPIGHRNQMLGKAPIIKGKLFQDLKNKPNIIGKLWAKTSRSINNFISETSEQRGVILDEEGNLIDQLPIFYTGRARTDAELKAVNAEIDSLNNKKKKGLIIQDLYDKEIAILKGRRASLQNRPSKGEINRDMGAALLRFSAMAEHYEVMSSVEDTFKAFIKVLEQRTYQPSDDKVTLGKWIKGKFIPKGKKEGLESNVVRRAKKWMSMVFYDNNEITKGFWVKLSEQLMEYSSLTYVAFNPFGNFNNYALGRINNSIEALGQRFFSGESYARAELEFNTNAIPGLLHRLSSATKKIGSKSDYDSDLPGNKYEALVDLFRMMDSKSDIREVRGGPPINKPSLWTRFKEFGYTLQDTAEYNVQTKVGMALLMDTKIMNKTTGDILSLYDAFEFDSNSKEVKLKNGYNTIVILDKKNVDENGKPKVLKEQLYNDEYRYQLRNNIREINKQIHGNYAKDDRMIIQSHVLGRFAAQFHKWVAPAIKARFRKEYFDENLGWMEGRYRSFWKFLAFTTKEIATIQFEYGRHNEKFLEQYGYTGDGSQRDSRAKDKLFGVYRTLADISITMLTFTIKQILDTMFSDDEDEDEFKTKTENFLRYQADRTYKELIVFYPLIGAQQQYQMVKSPLAIARTLGEFSEALYLSVATPLAYVVKSEEDFYLDSDYVYQKGDRKGELKVYKNWADAIPILYSIKKYQEFSDLTNFYIK